MTVECVRYLRQRFPDVIVSVEVEKPQRPGLDMLAAVADIVFYSKSWALVGTTKIDGRLVCGEFDVLIQSPIGEWIQVC